MPAGPTDVMSGATLVDMSGGRHWVEANLEGVEQQNIRWKFEIPGTLALRGVQLEELKVPAPAAPGDWKSGERDNSFV